MASVLVLAGLALVQVALVASAGSDAFCYLPYSIQQWDFKSGCNGEPQFLSSFCPNHAQVVGNALVMTLDNDNSCHSGSGDQCSPRKTAGAAFESREAVFYGNLTFVAKPARGSGVTTTLSAYGSASIAFGFQGSNLKQLGLTAGNSYPSVTLPFDAGDDFHAYTIFWQPSTTEFYVDDVLVYTHNGSITSSSLKIWAWLYACGASYCEPYIYTQPQHTAIARIAYTPLGASAAPNCTNPPLPPSFCDPQPAINSYWTPQTACMLPSPFGFNNSAFAYCAHHVSNATTDYVSLKADHNVSCYLPVECRSTAKAASAWIQLPSYIQLGHMAVKLSLSTTSDWAAQLLLTANTRNVSWILTSTTHSILQVDNVTQSLTLPAIPSTTATYDVIITRSNVSFGVDGTVLTVIPTSTSLPELAASLSLIPTSATVANTSAPELKVFQATYTATGDTTPSCTPPTLKPMWSDEFSGSSLGGAWTAYDNCTHGQEAELYVPQAVTVEDGSLKIKAFAFAHNETDKAGKSHAYGSGWVDSASNRSNQALNDCQSNNTQGFSMLYGRLDIHAKIPPGHFWPALWMMPDVDICWPTGGEIDILETDIWNGKPLPYEVQGTYHWSESTCYADSASGSVYPGCDGCDFSADFHTYSMESTPRRLTFLVDNNPYHTVTQVMTSDTLPKHPMYIIFGLQLWKDWNFTTDIPATFEIDWVRAYSFD